MPIGKRVICSPLVVMSSDAPILAGEQHSLLHGMQNSDPVYARNSSTVYVPRISGTFQKLATQIFYTGHAIDNPQNMEIYDTSL
ncbi:hypothetical protein GDO78_022299 [Eleutherodactylus coqui]|uniref:Uncharacterized protein n=1 Tax=Eleutherodactylus coqui TaxID=57060 RepID=A0A8J6E7W7_ELECQ|nr:hypothetical protein GDO78_022299 [Eleutherodactylus coqui]